MKRQDEEKSAVGYVGVSSDEQVEGLSIESQKAKIREWCSTRGYKLTGFFADVGESAYNDDTGKRPQFARLLEQLPVLQPDVVVVFSLDRWARSTVVSSQTFRLLANLQIGFASVSEAEWNFADPSARLVLNILANVAEFSSASTGQHVRRVSDLKFEKGLHRGSIPFGYRRDPTSTRADPRPPVPEEPSIVQWWSCSGER